MYRKLLFILLFQLLFISNLISQNLNQYNIDNYLQNNNVDSALNVYNQVKTMINQSKRSKNQLYQIADQILSKISIYYHQLKQFDIADEYGKEKLLLAKQSNDSFLIIKNYNQFSELLYEHKKIEQAFDISNQSIDYIQNILHTPQIDSVISQIWCVRGKIFSNMSEQINAISCFKKSYQLINYQKSISQEISVLGYLINELFEMCEYEQINYYSHILDDIYPKINESGLQGLENKYSFYNTKYLVLTYLEKYQEALVVNDSMYIAYSNFIDCLIKQNPQIKQTSLINPKISYYCYKTFLLSQLSDKSKIEEIANDIVKDSLQYTNNEKATLYNYLSSAYSNLDEYSKALEYIQKSIYNYKIVYKNQTFYLFESRITEFEILFALKRYQEALSICNEIENDINISIENDNINSITFSLYKGLALLALKRYEEANLNIKNGIDKFYELINYQYLNVSNSAFQKLFDKFNNLRDIVLLSCEMQNTFNDDFSKTIYNSVLLSKNISYHSQQVVKKMINASPELSELYNQFIDIRRKINENKKLSIKQRDSLYLLSGKLEQKLSSKNSQFTELKDKILSSFETVQKQLKEGEIVVEFATPFTYSQFILNSIPEFCNNTYFAIAFDSKSQYPQIIPLFTQEDLNKYYVLSNTINKTSNQSIANSDDLNQIDNANILYKRLTIKNTLNVNLSIDKIETIFNNKELTQIIWKKILDKFTNVSTIYFSPIGSLVNISIEYLEIEDGVCMSDKYNMHRVLSTSNLNLVDTLQSYNSYLLYGGINYDLSVNDQTKFSNKYLSQDYCYRVENNKEAPLCYLASTIEEIDYVYQKQKSKSTIYCFKGDSAVEESFKYYSTKSPEVIHIATHGFSIIPNSINRLNNYDILKYSGLAFAGANNYRIGNIIPNNIDDGILTASEISELNLSNTKLAILSACNTGVGLVNNNGLYGLQRGFKLAGVNKILQSLWPISDEATSLMMRKFYDALWSGLSPAEALNQARKFLKNGNRFNEPFYWACFVLVE